MADIPLAYPKIPGPRGAGDGRCIAFEKYDGTNLHFVWDREFGWIDFGTRRDRFALDATGEAAFAAAHPGLEEAAQVFRGTLAGPLAAILGRLTGTATVFAEFLGPSSFAGRHKPGEPKELVLFDVLTADGLIDPEAFVAAFAGVRSARVVYRGKFAGQLVDDVRRGRYDVAEGVVIKGRSAAGPWMAKVKTEAYLARLKAAFADRWEDYWE